MYLSFFGRNARKNSKINVPTGIILLLRKRFSKTKKPPCGGLCGLRRRSEIYMFKYCSLDLAFHRIHQCEESKASLSGGF